MQILVFTNDIGGHHLEYIHHLYELAVDDAKNSYVFILPNAFSEISEEFHWGTTPHNVSFELFDASRFCACADTSLGLLRSSYKVCQFAASRAKQYHADIFYTNQLINFVPFAPFFFRPRVKLVGIIYRVYLYDLDRLSSFNKLIERCKYLIMVTFRIYHRVMVLNDDEGTTYLNRLYRTQKFCSIPDPYIPIPANVASNIRNDFQIAPQRILFVHFGAMNKNKGTLEIMESIKTLKDDEACKYSFFFAGIVYDDIRETFYQRYEELKGKTQIVIKDAYCSRGFFASLCLSCNAILTPYNRTAQSSGLIGFASQFKKPVIATGRGLLGALVDRYGLGITIENNSPQCLIDAYRKVSEGNAPSPTQDYCKRNTIENFQRSIASCFT